MNKSVLFDNKKFYLIDIETHVVFTPGYKDPTEALDMAMKVNDMPIPKLLYPLYVGIVSGLPINNAGYKSTLPLITLIDDRQKALKKFGDTKK